MHKIRKVRYKILLLISGIIILMGSLLIAQNYLARQIVKNNAFRSYSNMLDIFTSDVDLAFGNVEDYLYSLSTKVSIPALYHPGSRNDFFSQEIQISRTLEATMQSITFIDELFIYMPDPVTCENGDIVNSQFVYAPDSSISFAQCDEMRAVIEKWVSENKDSRPPQHWFFVEDQERHYIMRIFKSYNLYIGAIVSSDQLLQFFRTRGDEFINYAAYFSADGHEYGNSLPVEAEGFHFMDETGDHSVRIGSERYMIVKQPSDSGSYYLVALINEKQFQRHLLQLNRFLHILMPLFLALILVIAYLLRKWILAPLQKLTDAMNAVKSGDMTVRMDNYESEEFILVNDTFNSMIESINDLNHRIIEETTQRQEAQIQYQNIELQYLKLQINPHFFINCLDVINNLTNTHREYLIREMTTYLSQYLRYTLQANTLELISTETEVVRNYLHIQQLRFPQRIIPYVEIEDGTENVLIPPMTIQTFVENAIKHRGNSDSRIEIYVAVTRKDPPADHMIQIEVWDNGSGFSNEILDKLRRGEAIIDARGEHYGINNVISRLHLIYKGREEITFDNQEETGGAYILIVIPDQPEDDNSKENHQFPEE